MNAVSYAPRSRVLFASGKMLPATNSVEDTFKLPETFKLETTVDEALEIKPPVSVDKPVTLSVPPTETLLQIDVAADTEVSGNSASTAAPTRNAYKASRARMLSAKDEIIPVT